MKCSVRSKPWSLILILVVLVAKDLRQVNGEFDHSLLLKEIQNMISESAAKIANDQDLTCNDLIVDILEQSDTTNELCDDRRIYPQVSVEYDSTDKHDIDEIKRCSCLSSLLDIISPLVSEDFLTTFCDNNSSFVCNRNCDRQSFLNDSSFDEFSCIVRASDIQQSTTLKSAGNVSVVGVITGLSCDNIKTYGFQVCKDILYPSPTEDITPDNDDSLKYTAGLVPGIIILILIAVIICTISISFYLHCKSKRRVESLHKAERAVYSTERNLDNPLYAFAATSLPDNVSKSTLMDEFQNHFNLKLIQRSEFTVVSELGQGAFGVVYKGHITNGSHENKEGQEIEIAIKTLKDNSTADEAREFMCEAAVMAEFQHPNVMNLLGLCIDTDDRGDTTAVQPMILLPYMVNGDLKSFLISSRKDNSVETLPERLSLDKLESICLNIAEGMKYLAELKYVHRDLAARNCMIDECLNIKVADFGFTRDVYGVEYYRLSRKTKLPVKWMAPESLLDNMYNEKTDVWSFGITCWEVFSLGRAPYPGIDNSEIPDYLKRGNRLKKPFLCPIETYSKIISKCWNDKPELRPSFNELVSEVTSMNINAHSSNGYEAMNRNYFMLDNPQGEESNHRHEVDYVNT